MFKEMQNQIELLFDEGDWINFRCFWPDKRTKVGDEKPKPKRKLSFWRKKEDVIEKDYEHLKILNEQGFGIYFGINPRKEEGGSGNKDVKFARCLCVDYDAKDYFGKENPSDWDKFTLEHIREKLEPKNFPVPTFVVRTGNGFHFWWRLVNPILTEEEWLTNQQKLCEDFNADDKSTNKYGGVMRLAGFTNTKYTDRLKDVKIVKINENAIYKIEEIEKHLVGKTKTTKKQGTNNEQKTYDWNQFHLNFNIIDIIEEAKERDIPYEIKDAASNCVLFHCVFTDGHNDDKDGHPSFSVFLTDEAENRKAGFGTCFTHSPRQIHYSFLDILLYANDSKIFNKSNKHFYKKKYELIKELNEKYPGFIVWKKKDYEKLNDKFENDEPICWDYNLEDIDGIINDFLNTVYFKKSLKYVECTRKNKWFTIFNPETNEWKCEVDGQVEQDLRQYLKHCTINGGKTKFPKRRNVINDLIAALRMHPEVYKKAPKNVRSFWFNDKENLPPAELLLPFANCNLWMHLEPPYKNKDIPITDNHFHFDVHKFSYKSTAYNKFLHKILKIAFEGDPKCLRLFLEFTGASLRSWNDEKKIGLMAPATNSAKSVLMALYEFALLEENCLPAEVSEQGTFTISDWVGRRAITWPEAWKCKKMEKFLSRIAADTGGDRNRSEEKHEKQIGSRGKRWHLMSSNETIAPNDTSGKWIERVLLIARPKSIPKEKQIKGLIDIIEKDSKEKGKLIMPFINLALMADKLRRERGGKWSKSKFELEQREEIEEESNPIIKSVKDLIEAGSDSDYLFVPEVFRTVEQWYKIFKYNFEFNLGTFGKAFRQVMKDEFKIEFPSRLLRKTDETQRQLQIYNGIKLTVYGEQIKNFSEIGVGRF